MVAEESSAYVPELDGLDYSFGTTVWHVIGYTSAGHASAICGTTVGPSLPFRAWGAYPEPVCGNCRRLVVSPAESALSEE